MLRFFSLSLSLSLSAPPSSLLILLGVPSRQKLHAVPVPVLLVPALPVLRVALGSRPPRQWRVRAHRRLRLEEGGQSAEDEGKKPKDGGEEAAVGGPRPRRRRPRRLAAAHATLGWHKDQGRSRVEPQVLHRAAHLFLSKRPTRGERDLEREAPLVPVRPVRADVVVDLGHGRRRPDLEAQLRAVQEPDLQPGLRRRGLGLLLLIIIIIIITFGKWSR
mmetsp:Transcript_9456/g.28748  ORF Transcript_9456/g.28748 Transcript_9456/m.28748 type:complete len:218 (-) Transcript_9456:352-1005(-)